MGYDGPWSKGRGRGEGLGPTLRSPSVHLLCDSRCSQFSAVLSVFSDAPTVSTVARKHAPFAVAVFCAVSAPTPNRLRQPVNLSRYRLVRKKEANQAAGAKEKAKADTAEAKTPAKTEADQTKAAAKATAKTEEVMLKVNARSEQVIACCRK